MRKKKNKKILFNLKLTHNIQLPITKLKLVFILLILIALAWIIIAQVRDIFITQQVTQARTSQEPIYDKDRFKKIQALHDMGIIGTTTPAYSSKIDACYVTHNDTGWVAANWYQDCYIRYTDLFPIVLSRSNVEQKLESSKDTPNLFGNLETFRPKNCGALYRNDSYKPTLIYLNWNIENAEKGVNCKIPKQTQDTFTVRGPIVLDKELTTKIERSFNVDDIDQTKRYLFVQSDNYYYHESLGCGIGILCPSPREKPLTGF